MSTCPECKTKYIKDANYCHNCGTALNSSKKNNGAGSPFDNGSIDASINNSFGRLMPKAYLDKILKANGKIEAERRVVTIVFADIKGSTALAENLDPEEVLEIMNGAFDVLVRPITLYDGTLARLMGDAILAFFGAPIAHENDPYLACRAAVDIINGVKKYSKKLEVEKGIKGFAARVGINTGLVVVGEVGTEIRVEYTAMGDAVNIAARMESAAEPNTVLITETTYKLIQNHFDCESRGLISVKGKAEPMNVFRVNELKKNNSEFEKNEKQNSKFIGRENELSELRDKLQSLENNKGVVISITGEQGVGKSRIVEEVRQSNKFNFEWTEGRAYSYTQKESYGLAKEILKNIITSNTEIISNELKEKLYEIVSSFKVDNLEDIFVPISHLLNFDIDTDNKSRIDLDDAETLKGQIHYAYKTLIKNISNKKPHVIILEDLHWADSASLELIEELFPLVEESPLLLILIHRSKHGEVWEMHNNYLNSANDNFLPLNIKAFNKNECGVFLRNMIEKPVLTQKFINKIFEETEGNPFFIEELIQSFLERKIIDSDKNLLHCDFIDKEFQVPNLLHSAILSRVDSLAHINKIVLQTASVIGKKIHGSLLRELLKNEISYNDFKVSIKELENRDFIITPESESKASENSEQIPDFIFKSSFIREVVYDTLLISQRKKNHQDVGLAIEKIKADCKNDYASLLAFHFNKAGTNRKAIKYCVMAAEKSKEIFANEDALFFFKRALELSDLVETNSSTLVDIHESLGDVYTLTSDYELAAKHYKEIFEFKPDKKRSAQINFKCGQVYERWGNYEDALNYYNECLNVLDSESDILQAALAYAGIGMVNYRKDDLNGALSITIKALELLKGAEEAEEISDIYNNLGIIYCKLDDLKKSLEYHKKCYLLKKQKGNLSGLAASNNNLGYLYQKMDNTDKALEYYNESLKICEKTGNLHGLARVYDNVSHVYLKLNKNELAQEYNIKAIVNLGKVALKGNEVRHDIWLQSGVW